MIKIIEELLSSSTITVEVAESLNNEWSTHTTKLNEEAKQLRLDNQTLSKNYEEIVKSKGDLDKQLEGLDSKIAEAKRAGQTEVQAQLEAERESKGELQKSLANLQKANTNLTLDSEVSKELSKFDIKKSDKEMVQFYLRSKVGMTDQGVKFIDGENTSDLSDAFGEYFVGNAARLNPMGDGNGSGANDGGNSGGANSMDRKAFEKLQPGMKADFMAKGGKLT